MSGNRARTATWIAGGLFVLTVALLVIAAPLKLLGLQKELPIQLAELLQAGAALPMAAVGALIVARRPATASAGCCLPWPSGSASRHSPQAMQATLRPIRGPQAP
jgi:hypothetical protein